MTLIEWLQSSLGTSWQNLFIAITYVGSDYAYIVLLSLYYWIVDPGGLLAWGGWRWQVSRKPALQIKIVIVSITVILAALFPEFARSLAVFTGFFICQFRFSPPTTIKTRFAVAIAGLFLVFCYYLLSGLVLSDSWAYWRYLGLALLVTEAYPRLAQRFTALR